MPAYRIGNKNVLFIHVPKTGGTSIETFLEAHAQPALHNHGRKLLKVFGSTALEPALAMQHFHADVLEAMFPAGFFDYAFMIVRHPQRRLISEYGHSRNLRRVDSRIPFNAWAQLALSAASLAPGISNNHFRPQSEFRCFGAEIFRFEDGIGSVLQAIAQRLGLPVPSDAPHEKRSSMSMPDVSARVSARIAAVYGADFRSFGYEPLDEVSVNWATVSPITNGLVVNRRQSTPHSMSRR